MPGIGQSDSYEWIIQREGAAPGATGWACGVLGLVASPFWHLAGQHLKETCGPEDPSFLPKELWEDGH